MSSCYLMKSNKINGEGVCLLYFKVKTLILLDVIDEWYDFTSFITGNVSNYDSTSIREIFRCVLRKERTLRPGSCCLQSNNGESTLEGSGCQGRAQVRGPRVTLGFLLRAFNCSVVPGRERADLRPPFLGSRSHQDEIDSCVWIFKHKVDNP